MAWRNAAASAGSGEPPKPRRPGCWPARHSIARSRVTAMAGRRSCDKTIQRRSARPGVVSIAVVSIGVDLAEPEKHAATPYAELLLAPDLLLVPELGQPIKDGSGEAGGDRVVRRGRNCRKLAFPSVSAMQLCEKGLTAWYPPPPSTPPRAAPVRRIWSPKSRRSANG